MRPTARVPASPFVSGMAGVETGSAALQLPGLPDGSQVLTAAAPAAPLASFRSDSNTQLGGARRVRLSSTPSPGVAVHVATSRLADAQPPPRLATQPSPGVHQQEQRQQQHENQQQQERRASLHAPSLARPSLLGMSGSFAIRGENPRFIDFRASALQAQLSQAVAAAAAAQAPRSQRSSAVRVAWGAGRAWPGKGL